MMKLAILGVTHLSDLYPNVKHKIQLISGMPGVETRLFVYDLGAGGFYQGLKYKSFVSRLARSWRLCWGTLRVFLQYLMHRTAAVYIAYPAPGLAVLLGLLPGRLRPTIYLDAFISLYDTAIVDREMFKPDSWQARLLFRFERQAFSSADHILVDTADNGSYYATLFNLPAARFHVIPLSIPPLLRELPAATLKPDVAPAAFVCLFIGSLVPLHGIGEILDVAALLSHVKGLQFVIIGDGQEAWRIEQFSQRQPSHNLVWHRGMFPTTFIVKSIVQADLCLGIFGHGDKATRVLPYKIYYYAALSKPFVTLRTPCLQHYCGEDAGMFLADNDPASDAALDKLVLRYMKDSELVCRAAEAAGELYRKQLGPDAITTALAALFTTAAPGTSGH